MAGETHAAVVTVAVRAPLEVHQVPTVPPVHDEVLLRVEWTASTPLDLHQADGGLLVKHPQVLGDGIAGTVLEIGPEVKDLKVDDKVFGFQWREQKEKGHQERITTPEWLLGKLPPGFTMQEAVTVPNNFVTACHTITNDLELPLPWPKPKDYSPPRSTEPILIWGAASSVGQYLLQTLTFYGYTNIIATASAPQHEYLKKLGARACYDYRDGQVVENIRNAFAHILLIVDCIGSKTGTLQPISKIAGEGSRVAVMLPVLVEVATDSTAPKYDFDVEAHAQWAPGVQLRGVRTHFYLENHEFKEKLQSEIMPTLMSQGALKPNRYRVIDGDTMLERAEKALAVLRSGTISGQRLVWRICDH